MRPRPLLLVTVMCCLLSPRPAASAGFAAPAETAFVRAVDTAPDQPTTRLSPAGPASQDVGGTWSRIFPATISGRAHHTIIFDPTGDRFVLFGGNDGTENLQDVWIRTASGSSSWSRLEIPPGPAARIDHSAIFDPIRQRMIVFGGTTNQLSQNYNDFFGDVWALSLTGAPKWEELVTSGPQPLARSSHAAIYDPVRDRMIVFGGYNGGHLDDLWALSLSGTPTWTQITPAGGATPGPQQGMETVYDPAGDRMLIVAIEGVETSPSLLDHIAFTYAVWELRLAEDPPRWARITFTGDPLLAAVPTPTGAYDPVRQRLIVTGGSAAAGGDNIYAIDLSGAPTMSQLAVSGPTPGARVGWPAVYVPGDDRFVAFGGAGDSIHSDTWSFSLDTETWTRLEADLTSLPAGRYGHVAVFDAPHDRMIVFGGADYLRGGVRVWNDTWSFSLDAAPDWLQLHPSGTPPTARYYHAAAFDPVRDRMIVFGGYDSAFRNDVWALSLAGDPTWEQLEPTGTPPDSRGRTAMVYDSKRDRMLVFGGYTTVPINDCDVALAYFNDVWALELSDAPRWTPIVPSGPLPSARAAFVAVYDAVRDRLLISGGESDSAANDTWVLPLRDGGPSTWTPLDDAIAESPREAHCGVLDPVHHRLVEFSGDHVHPETGGVYPSNDVRSRGLAGSAPWRELATTGDLPLPRMYATAVYDEAAARMVAFGGLYGNVMYHDVWALDLSKGPLDQVVPLASANAPAASPTAAASDALPRALASADGTLSVEFSLPGDGPARLELFDVGGRRIASQQSGSLGAGRHRVQLAIGRDLPPGVYLVRLTAAGHALTVKAAVLE